MTVVMTTDRSERSLRVARHAARLARATGRGLVALHVMPRPATAEVDAERAWFEHEMEATGAAAELTTALDGLEPHPSVVVGHPRRGESLHAAILRQANDQHALALAVRVEASAVSVATRGQEALNRPWPGSTPLSLLQRSPLPVILTHGAT